MTDYKHGDWYCKPANEEEAKEIVLRAIASGAVSTRAWGFNSSNYGVNSGNVTAIVSAHAVKYTIDELRQKFPLPGECVESAEWNGEWLPPVGTVCELLEGTEFLSLQDGILTIKQKGEKVSVIGHAKRIDNDAVCVVLQPVNDMRCGFCVGNHEFLCGPIRTDRERWVEAASNGLSGDMSTLKSSEFILGQIYDAMQSGQLKAPSNEPG